MPEKFSSAKTVMQVKKLYCIQFLERSIRKLDFRSSGVNNIFQVNDLMNAPGPRKRELRLATTQALPLLQDNYPEFVAKQVCLKDDLPFLYRQECLHRSTPSLKYGYTGAPPGTSSHVFGTFGSWIRVHMNSILQPYGT
ncbi:hypothetical protein E3N88_20095 [Mikania micrantha]|uniref:Uncharacterized protein n=1 Tax=Mikania micrantha TaxID=192012 RepID=A0A5N6NG50_9ASTR|nr:hypothetical protein E3N88_20095 [Mikania micrantha]